MRGRSAARHFIVKTDAVTDDDTVVLAYASVPDPGDVHPNDATMVVTEVAAKPRDGDAKLWDVDVAYNTSTAIFGFRPDDWQASLNYNTTPTARKPSITFSTGFREVEVYQAFDYVTGLRNQPIVNSAGQSFDPQPTMQRPTFTLTVVKNQLLFDPIQAAAYAGAVNSDDWTINEDPLIKLLPGLGRIRIDAQTVSEAGGFYWVVTYTIDIDSEGWNLKPLDQGLAKRDDNDRLVVVRDANNTAYTAPVNLDGQGRVLPDVLDPVFHDFRVYPELPFAALGIFA